MRQPVEFVARVVGSRSRSVEGLIRRMRCCFNTPVILTFDERADLRRQQLPPEVQRPRVRDVIIHCVEGTAGSSTRAAAASHRFAAEVVEGRDVGAGRRSGERGRPRPR